MRVIAGEVGGIPLKAPKGAQTRPTEDYVKESIFNIISPIKKDALVLDLFSGSGSIGIEFLSRGAGKVYFIDRDEKSTNTIRKNLEKVKYLDRSKVIKSDADRFLKGLADSGIKFDYIYIDPPFERQELYEKVLKRIIKLDLLLIDGIIIIESCKEGFIPDINGMSIIDVRNYGNTVIFFTKLGE